MVYHCEFKFSRINFIAHSKIYISRPQLCYQQVHVHQFHATAMYMHFIFYCIYNILYACHVFFPFQWYPTPTCSLILNFKLLIELCIWLHLYGYC